MFFPLMLMLLNLSGSLNVQVYTQPSQSEHWQIKKYAHKIPISQ